MIPGWYSYDMTLGTLPFQKAGNRWGNGNRWVDSQWQSFKVYRGCHSLGPFRTWISSCTSVSVCLKTSPRCGGLTTSIWGGFKDRTPLSRKRHKHRWKTSLLSPLPPLPPLSLQPRVLPKCQGHMAPEFAEDHIRDSHCWTWRSCSCSGQQKKMKNMETLLPHDMSSGERCSEHRGLRSCGQDQCFFLYGV